MSNRMRVGALAGPPPLARVQGYLEVRMGSYKRGYK